MYSDAHNDKASSDDEVIAEGTTQCNTLQHTATLANNDGDA